MPGLKQLKRFSTDLLTLGDEVKIRAARGERPSTLPIPANVEDRDDSEDFVLGVPTLSEEEIAQADAAAAEKARDANDFSDITGTGKDTPAAQEAESFSTSIPDMSDLLSVSDTADFDDLDLSEFEEPEKPKEPPKPKEIPIEDLDLDALLAPSNKPSAPQETEIEDIPEAEPEPVRRNEPAAAPAPEPEPALDSYEADLPPEVLAILHPELAQKQQQNQAPSSPEEELFASLSNSEPANNAQSFDSPASPAPVSSDADDIEELEELDELEEIGDEDFNDAVPVQNTSPADDFSLPDFGSSPTAAIPSDNFSAAQSPVKDETTSVSLDDFLNPDSDFTASDPVSVPSDDFSLPDFGSPSSDASVPSDDFSLPDFDSPSADVSVPSDDFSLPDFDSPSADASVPSDDFSLPDFDSPSADASVPSDDFSLPDFDSPSADASVPSDDFSLPDFDSPSADASVPSDDFSLPDFDSPSADASVPSDDFSLPDFDSPSADASVPSDDIPLDAVSDDFALSTDVPAFDAETSPDIDSFGTSSMDNMDFGNEPQEISGPMNAGETDFETGNFGASDILGDFNIPGFSDTAIADLSKSKPKVSSPDFSNAKTYKDGRPKNTFTDVEYEKFQKNLSEYPLNVRIAIEDLVVKNEFTDDAVFEILEKVLKKVPARQIATDLEKMLDISIDVPRDYERRTAEEYEAYKKSFEYHLKNKIIPGAIISTIGAMIVFCLFIIIKTFIYIPATATKYYKRGWACLQREEYPQSEMEFDKALSYKPEIKWFYKYAQGYRDHKQYDRSVMMYRAIIQRFKHEKSAGLKWAEMELNDRFNYEEAERILKREVLDYHINDSDALLLLGDTYLEWATEKDPEQYHKALEQYTALLQNYGTEDQNLYLSRMMRYYIRTDNLAQVLQYKEYFFPLKKGLEQKDMTELSGYLLDKRYGNLTQAEEPLRIRIEDLRTMLEKAVKENSNDPVAVYNYGRYFVETSNHTAAQRLLNSALDLFKLQNVRNKRDTHRMINTYRLLGELLVSSREYIKAEEFYTDGISTYERENEINGFESDENIGKLYADLGDINYFLAGNLDYAKSNYINAINNKNDTPSIRYKVGYIQYVNKEYQEALGSFIRASDIKTDDTHLLLALANTLSLRNDNYAAQGYYEKVLRLLDKERQRYNILLPQVREDQADIVDTYMKASNNLGVTLSRIAYATGNSKMNAEAIYRLTESLRAYDALTRNQTTMERQKEASLPQMNIKYIDRPTSTYSPEIFTEIPRTLNGEKGIEQ